MDQKQVEEESAPTLKPQQDRLEQNVSGLTDLTTSTINGKTTVVAPERARVESTKPAAPIDAATVAPPDREVRLQPPRNITECHDKATRCAWRRPSTRLTPTEGVKPGSDRSCRADARSIHDFDPGDRTGRERRRSVNRRDGPLCRGGRAPGACTSSDCPLQRLKSLTMMLLWRGTAGWGRRKSKLRRSSVCIFTYGDCESSPANCPGFFCWPTFE